MVVRWEETLLDVFLEETFLDETLFALAVVECGGGRGRCVGSGSELFALAVVFVISELDQLCELVLRLGSEFASSTSNHQL